MADKSMDECRRRLARLERANRVVFLALAVTLVAGVSTLIMGAAARAPAASNPPEVFRAKRFDLVDAQGRPRAVLHMAKDGPVFEFFGTNGKRRMTLVGSPTGSAAAFHDGSGAPRVSVTGTTDGSSLTLYGTDNNMKVSLGIEGAHRAHIGVTAQQNRHMVGLRLDEDDAELIAGTEGGAAVKVGISEREPLIVITSAAGKTVFKKP